MTNTSRNSITKQPHNKKSNHQHHAAHASVIHLRIMSTAILTHLKIGGDDGDGNGAGGGGSGDGGDGGASGGGRIVVVVMVVLVVDNQYGASSLSTT
jgi:hypothetical protein